MKKTLYEIYGGKMKNPFAASCTFCGLKDAQSGQERESHWLACPHCKARGPIGKNNYEATVHWNILDGVKPDTKREIA